MAIEPTQVTTKASPWWLSGMLFLGLFFLFMGERAFAHTGLATQLSWLGTLLIATSIGLRGWVLMNQRGEASKSQASIERLSILSSFGVLLALVGYYLTTKSGMNMLGIEQEATIARWQMVMTVLWVIILVIATVPLALIEFSLGTARRGSFQSIGNDSAVDVFRVKSMAVSGLTIALAASFLMVTCNIAKDRNVSSDYSYFKTSAPGSATVNIAKTLNEQVRVLLFFPENNDVALEVGTYIDSLRSQAANIVVEYRDRLLDAKLAKEYKASRDGTIVLVRGEKSEKFTVSTDIKKARRKELREFDSKFQKALLGVIRDVKVAYFLVGHGELNDPKSGSKLENTPLTKSTVIKQVLKQLNYKTENYEGYGKPVPDDCDILFILAPRVALMDSELQAIDDYLARGGAAILSMDPDSKMRLGVLQQRLGLKFNPAPILDDKEFMVRARNVSDHQNILTNQFLSHASISALGRGSARTAMLFVNPGSWDKLDGKGKPQVTELIRSLRTSFRKQDDNFVFDKDVEARKRYTLVSAIEDKTAVPENLAEGATHNGMRVIAIADSEVLSDGILTQIAVVQHMLIDIIKWTGGEEAYNGETTSEKDNRIEHSKSQDAAWFYATILGAPLLVLGLGMLLIRLRKRRLQRRKS